MSKITLIVVLLLLAIIAMVSAQYSNFEASEETELKREKTIQILTNKMKKKCNNHPEFKICKLIAKILLHPNRFKKLNNFKARKG